MKRLTICLVLLLVVGCGGDPNQKANKLFVEAVQLIESAETKSDQGSDEEAVKDYEKALSNVQKIIDDYSESDLAVKLISGETLFTGSTLADIKGKLALAQKKLALAKAKLLERRQREALDVAPAIDGTLYLLTERPQDVLEVKQILADAKDGDKVAVVGRIGGSREPWIKGLSVFTLVDSALTPCNERPGDQCATPWDYCCQANLAANQTLIKVVDKQGEPLEVDARKLLGVKELQTVVVQGKVQRDQAGNLSVLASGVFIRR